jgi:hypothetical protein
LVAGGKLRFAGGKNGAWMCFRAHTGNTNTVACAAAGSVTSITGNQNDANQCTAIQADWANNPIFITWTDATKVKLSYIHCSTSSDSGTTPVSNASISVFSGSKTLTLSATSLAVTGKLKIADGVNGAWLCFRSGSENVEIPTCSAAGVVTTIGIEQSDSVQCTAQVPEWSTSPLALTLMNAKIKKLSYIHCTTSSDIGSDAVANVDIGVSPNTVCAFDGSTVATVKFITELGNLPVMSFSTASLFHSVLNALEFSVYETIAGNKIGYECSNAGTCDRSSGQCKCFSTYTSSDGQGNLGRRADCGFQDVEAPGMSGSIGNTMMLTYSMWPF